MGFGMIDTVNHNQGMMRVVERRVEIASAKDALSKKDFLRIIHDSGMFWQTFCIEYAKFR